MIDLSRAPCSDLCRRSATPQIESADGTVGRTLKVAWNDQVFVSDCWADSHLSDVLLTQLTSIVDVGRPCSKPVVQDRVLLELRQDRRSGSTSMAGERPSKGLSMHLAWFSWHSSPQYRRRSMPRLEVDVPSLRLARTETALRRKWTPAQAFSLAEGQTYESAWSLGSPSHEMPVSATYAGRRSRCLIRLHCA